MTSLTVQELCDLLTALCHEGHAQAKVKYISGYELKDVTDIKLCGKEFDVAIIEGGE
jgi:hypothetical protein